MLSAIIISPDEKFRDNTRKLLEGFDLIDVRTELNALDNETSKLQSTIIVVDLSPNKEQGFQAIQKTIELHRHSYVFVAGDRTDMDLVLRCMRAGAKEFLSAPIESQQLFSAIDRVRKVIRNRPLGE